MGILPSEIGEPVIGDERAKYLPFPVAVEHRIVEPDSIDPISPQAAAMMIQNGFMPPQAGIVELGPELGAFDLVSARYEGSKLTIAPTAKEAVNRKTDAIQSPGLIILTLGDGLLRACGISQSTERTAWSQSRQNFPKNRRYEVTPLSSLDPGTDFELDEIDWCTGSLIAFLRRRYF